MSFPRYPKYKDSGIKWLGEVPAHWGVRKMKWVAKMESGHTPDKKVQEYWENGDIPWVSLNDTGYLKEHDYISDTAFHVTELGIANSSAHLLPARAVVFSRDATIGRCAITTRPMAVSQHFIAWICGDSMIPEYLLLVLRSMTQELDGLTTGATLKTIGMPEVRTLVTPVPPLEDQVAITAFLGRETAKVDALIAEQQRLIELLTEKRQAVISHAVTMGLNPNASIKPSGVEWLGEVPARWEVKKLRFLCDVQTGSRDTEDAVNDGRYPFFVRSQTVERIDTWSFNCEAVLTAGDGAGVGKVFHYHHGAFDFHQRVYMLNNFRGVSGRFLFHFLRANFYKVALEGGAKSTVDSLRRPMFMNFWVCVPPREEQDRIVMEIDRVTECFDTLTTEAQRAIELLQERRTALISAAVTGQIDVRGTANRSAA